MAKIIDDETMENVCWKGRLANGIGVHLDISVG